ncbi:MAG: hypothetical protein JKX99_09220 [Robiginitomaculum sp.]|nr:hypothetical protein [Robiginitomaculum sp.]
MNMFKKIAVVCTFVGCAAPVLAADGYRPQNDAQRNYKACAVDVMEQGVKLASPFCGVLPARPVFPGYDIAFSNKLSAGELDIFSVQLRLFKNQVAQYQTCINTRVMADGSLSNETLNYAACADQWAVEQKGKSAEEWGLSCLGQNDWEHPGSSVPARCFGEEE